MSTTKSRLEELRRKYRPPPPAPTRTKVDLWDDAFTRAVERHYVEEVCGRIIVALRRRARQLSH
jgi:hypothetical protein